MNAFQSHAEAIFSSDDVLQKRAFAKFCEMGVPSYSYLPLSQLRNFKLQAPKSPKGDFQRSSDSPYELVFIDGIFQAGLSSTLVEDIVLLPLQTALKEYRAFLQGHTEKQLDEEKDALALMTAGLAQEGYFLYVPPSVKAGLSVINVQTTKSAFTRLQILVGRKAECHLVWKNTSQVAEAAFSGELINIQLEENATCHFDKVDGYQPKGWAFSYCRVQQKKESFFKTVVLSTGAHSARHDIQVSLLGEKAKAEVVGLNKVKGFCQAHNRVLIEHKAPNTESHQLFKSILDDVARSSFQGEIFVTENALKTNAFQLSNSLLLSDKAIAYSKPELRIFADDVKASHGATVGQLDDELLFYLTSRGITKEAAAHMMTISFAEDVLKELSSPLSQKEARKLFA